MTPEASFEKLMADLKAGNQEAAAQIFQRFAHRLIALARSRLNAVIRQKVDPDDVVQSVFRSFFARQADGQWNLESWESLWGLLALITVRKCGHHIEYFRAERRDVHREVPGTPAADDSSSSWQTMARDPTASEVAMLAETVETLLSSLEPRDRQIVERSLQGEGAVEISTRVGCTERTVRRVLERVRKRLEQLRGGDNP
jgi:RNA polymerase sigma-70 factor (ECF subfamily)